MRDQARLAILEIMFFIFFVPDFHEFSCSVMSTRLIGEDKQQLST